MTDEDPTCMAVRDRLTAFVDDELDGRARDEVAAHLRACVACEREAAAVREVAGALGAEVREWREAPASRKSHVALARRARTSARVAAALLLIAASGALWMAGEPPDGREILADLRPLERPVRVTVAAPGHEESTAWVDADEVWYIDPHPDGPRGAKGAVVGSRTGSVGDWYLDETWRWQPYTSSCVVIGDRDRGPSALLAGVHRLLADPSDRPGWSESEDRTPRDAAPGLGVVRTWELDLWFEPPFTKVVPATRQSPWHERALDWLFPSRHHFERRLEVTRWIDRRSGRVRAVELRDDDGAVLARLEVVGEEPFPGPPLPEGRRMDSGAMEAIQQLGYLGDGH